MQSSASKQRFQFENAHYADYIAWAKKLVETGRIFTTSHSSDYIQKCIAANIPAESYPTFPTRHGILLIHGLSSSPMGMSSLYQYFAEKNYLVRSLLLPGHGTRPGDLLDVTYQDWLETCRFGIKTLREEVEHVSVIAFSAGSALAVYLSLIENSIDSLVLLAPAIALKHPLSAYYAKILYFLRKFSTRMNWPIIKKEEDYAKYQSIPINGIYQIITLINKIHRLPSSLKVPLYMASTVDDETISHQKAIDFFLRQSHSLNRGIIYTTEPHPELHPCLKQRSSLYTEEKILDFSHISLTVSADHPHYGKKGDFSDFSHYHPDKKPNKENHVHSRLHHGAASKKNLDNHLIQRLSYNPDFNYLAADIEHFLQDCLR